MCVYSNGPLNILLKASLEGSSTIMWTLLENRARTQTSGSFTVILVDKTVWNKLWCVVKCLNNTHVIWVDVTYWQGPKIEIKVFYFPNNSVRHESIQHNLAKVLS